MNPRRPDKTLADYVGIAISPMLIMAMVGSLTFFLLEIGYEGDFAGRLRWTLFWFVLASVLVSRISIEQGSGIAGIYGFGLAVTTGMMIHRFVGMVLVVWLLLAFIWWCASKLTWDCTLIDDDEDASGAGLLQVAGLDDSAQRAAPAEPQATETSAADERESETAAPSATVPWWRRLFQNRAERDDQPHSPGLWVVYFSLVALPAFGVGQLIIPSDNPASRRYAFALLVIYVASALGLLLMTSFLGLRRYLRQRRLQMPGAMAANWIALGTCLAVGILLACVLLPRPDAKYSLTSLVSKIGSPEQAAWERALGEEAAQGESARAVDRRERGPGDGQSASGEDEQGSGPGSEGSRRGRTPGGLPQLSVADLLRWILYALFAALLVRALYRHRAKLLAALRQILGDLLNFWRRLFGWKPVPAGCAVASASPETREAPKPFSAYRNPFTSGWADRMRMDELISYTFEALQAWARDLGYERRPPQTPFEFAMALSEATPALSQEIVEVTRMYGRLAYAGQLPPPERVAVLETLWQRMTVSANAAVERVGK